MYFSNNTGDVIKASLNQKFFLGKLSKLAIFFVYFKKKKTYLNKFLQNDHILQNGPFRKQIRNRFLVGRSISRSIRTYSGLNFWISNSGIYSEFIPDLDFPIQILTLRYATPTLQFRSWSPTRHSDSPIPIPIPNSDYKYGRKSLWTGCFTGKSFTLT